MHPKVALVNMPFGFNIYPSIQLGTLSTILKTHGREVRSFYLNLYFSDKLGPAVYSQLCEKRFLIGDWLFSHLLFGDSSRNKEYLNRFYPYIQEVCRSIGHDDGFLLDLKTKMVPGFLKWAADAFDWGKYDVVGFTSTFNQNMASFTLAKLIKDRYPSIKIVFGGSNFESEMGLEYFRVFKWIDYAVIGEAEYLLPGLMEAIEGNGPIPEGVAYRNKNVVVYEENHQIFAEFEKYGPPDYDDYFDQLRAIDPTSPLLENPIILYETSRGCWWGEKHHCTFCGLNASSMKFRAKTRDKILEEIAFLSRRYNAYRFRIVDNILDMKYIDGVFGKLREEGYDLEFFVEVKSNLTKGQIKTLAYGGVKVIQPGIESLSSNQLKEMNKGVSPIQNILCLKWAFYYGMEISWNILTGFPGETDEDYRRQVDIIKSIFHLLPPTAVGDFWLERFSPYFNRPQDYGIKNMRPGEAFSYIYDPEEIDLMKIAYDFEFETINRIDPALKEKLHETVAEWKRRVQSDDIPFLFFMKSIEFVTVYDGREKGKPVKTHFIGPAAWIILFCNESPRSLEEIRLHIKEKGGQEGEITQIESIIQDLEKRRLLFGEKGRYLTLALPHNSHL
ncbi:MAG: RiPP maturation radical SAM protein 1 [Nitrospirae bacterium]|nr:RiPP maturation radical SAM protein 1 [Nitrospirota bacterium]